MRRGEFGKETRLLLNWKQLDRPLNSMVSCKFNGRLKPCPYQPTTVEQDCGRKKKRQKGETRWLFN
jgi:hypothetical protein